VNRLSYFEESQKSKELSFERFQNYLKEHYLSALDCYEKMKQPKNRDKKQFIKKVFDAIPTMEEKLLFALHSLENNS